MENDPNDPPKKDSQAKDPWTEDFGFDLSEPSGSSDATKVEHLSSPNQTDHLIDSQLRRLDYRNPRYGNKWHSGPGRGLEVTVGFFAYFGMVACQALIFKEGLSSGRAGGLLMLFPLLMMIALACYLQGYRDWRGFVPGFLMGLGLSCLIGFGGAVWFVFTCKAL